MKVINQSTFKEIDRSIRTLDLKPVTGASAALPETLSARLTRVLQVFEAIRPLLTVLAMVPLIPPSWRAAIAFFTQSVEALAQMWPEGAGNVPANFKAGKDL